jgi:hypothetical protein
MAFPDATKGSCLHSVKTRYRAAVVNDGKKEDPIEGHLSKAHAQAQNDHESCTCKDLTPL